MSPGSFLHLGGVASPRLFKPLPPFQPLEVALANVWGDDEKDGFAIFEASEAWAKDLVKGTDKSLETVMARVGRVVASTKRGTSPIALIEKLKVAFRELELI